MCPISGEKRVGKKGAGNQDKKNSLGTQKKQQGSENLLFITNCSAIILKYLGFNEAKSTIVCFLRHVCNKHFSDSSANGEYGLLRPRTRSHLTSSWVGLCVN